MGNIILNDIITNYGSGNVFWSECNSLCATKPKCSQRYDELTTLDPSTIPTVGPTTLPSTVPTTIPTLLPTIVPTAEPSQPTATPTEPTTKPSTEPTDAPSFNPTTSNPTSTPTMTPSNPLTVSEWIPSSTISDPNFTINISELLPTENTEDKKDELSNNPIEGESSSVDHTVYILFLIIVSMLFIFLCLCCCMMKLKMRKRSKTTQHTKRSQNIEKEVVPQTAGASQHDRIVMPAKSTKGRSMDEWNLQSAENGKRDIQYGQLAAMITGESAVNIQSQNLLPAAPPIVGDIYVTPDMDHEMSSSSENDQCDVTANVDTIKIQLKSEAKVNKASKVNAATNQDLYAPAVAKTAKV